MNIVHENINRVFELGPLHLELVDEVLVVRLSVQHLQELLTQSSHSRRELQQLLDDFEIHHFIKSGDDFDIGLWPLFFYKAAELFLELDVLLEGLGNLGTLGR